MHEEPFELPKSQLPGGRKTILIDHFLAKLANLTAIISKIKINLIMGTPQRVSIVSGANTGIGNFDDHMSTNTICLQLMPHSTLTQFLAYIFRQRSSVRAAAARGPCDHGLSTPRCV